jgi:S1-C subfamily serine protease
VGGVRRLGWLVLIALGAAAAHAVMMPRSAADRSLDAAVASGTGFFVSADGVVLTAHHVVDGCAEISPALAAARPGGREAAAGRAQPRCRPVGS